MFTNLKKIAQSKRNTKQLSLSSVLIVCGLCCRLSRYWCHLVREGLYLNWDLWRGSLQGASALNFFTAIRSTSRHLYTSVDAGSNEMSYKYLLFVRMSVLEREEITRASSTFNSFQSHVLLIEI